MFPYVAASTAALVFAGLSAAVVRFHGKARLVASSKFTSSRSTIFDLAAVTILVSLAAVRSVSVGTDTPVYAAIFDSLSTTSDWGMALSLIPQEPGYTLLSLAVKSVGGNFTSLLWVTSAITVGAAYWGLKRMSKNFWMSLWLYIAMGFYLQHFNVLRQGVAVSLVLLGASYLGTRRGVLPFLLLNALAVSFHTSAVAALMLLPVLSRWKVNIRRLIFWVALAGIAAAAVWASPWAHALVKSLSPRYTQYLEWEVEAGVGLYLLLLVRFTLLAYAIWLSPPTDDIKYAAWSTIGILFSVLGTQSVIGSRVDSYFLIFLCVLVPNIVRERRVASAQVAVILAGSGVYFVLYVLNYAGLVPYAVA